MRQDFYCSVDKDSVDNPESLFHVKMLTSVYWFLSFQLQCFVTATTVEDSGRRLPYPASPFSCNSEAALGGELGVVWQSSEQQLWTSIFPSPARMLKQSPLASSDDSAAASLSGEEPLIRFFSDVGRRRHRSSAMVISHPSSQVVSFPSLFPRQCSSGVGRWRSWRKLPVDAPVSPPRSNGNAMGGGGMSATISSKAE
nr:hypothetical protein Iba_chr12cCG13250 [Ipomoea batatas]